MIIDFNDTRELEQLNIDTLKECIDTLCQYYDINYSIKKKAEAIVSLLDGEIIDYFEEPNYEDYLMKYKEILIEAFEKLVNYRFKQESNRRRMK